MQHLCHLRFMVNIIDVSIVVITVRVCGMFLAGSNISFFASHTKEVYQQRWQTKQKINQFIMVKTSVLLTPIQSIQITLTNERVAV